MGKSYRRHHKRPKRKHSRRRKGGVDGNVPKSSFSMSDMSKHLNNAYDSGVKAGVKAAQPHVEKMGNMVTDLHKQAYDSGKKSYKGFKYSSPTNFAIAKSGESAYSSTSKAMQPHYEKMKSSMGSMGSSMGFSSLSTKTPNVKELQHAQEASSMGVPTAFSQTSQTSAL
jgi:leucyl aminopeptidase (aminopeptidase T)